MSLKIVYMGTPDFAVPSLKILVENGYDIVGVITATDKLGGRGKKKLLESPVKKFALKHNLKVLQPKNLKSPAFQEELRSLKADLQVVVAFRMLPVAVWDMPPIGTINLHGSLLPKYRGAAPINWAVINGEKETGVTTFFLKHEIDTGDILFQEKMDIKENETAGDVHDRMMNLGAQLVLRSVQAIERGDYILKPQPEEEVTKAPKIFHETCQINFDQTVQTVHDFIRGLSPYPAAWTTLDEKELKILKTRARIEAHSLTPGQVLLPSKGKIEIAVKDGFLEVLELQLQGKKRLSTKDFLNGFTFEEKPPIL